MRSSTDSGHAMPASTEYEAATDDFPVTVPAGDAAAEVALAGGSELRHSRTMRRSLQLLLDRVHGSREALPHLAALEAALDQEGTSALDGASQKVLSKIHTQLRVLPLDPADGPIQDLLALVRRTLRHLAAQTHQLSPFDPEATVVITEASHSEFIDALGEARQDVRH